MTFIESHDKQRLINAKWIVSITMNVGVSEYHANTLEVTTRNKATYTLCEGTIDEIRAEYERLKLMLNKGAKR